MNSLADCKYFARLLFQVFFYASLQPYQSRFRGSKMAFRTLLSISLIVFSTFNLVSVESFELEHGKDWTLEVPKNTAEIRIDAAVEGQFDKSLTLTTSQGDVELMQNAFGLTGKIVSPASKVVINFDENIKYVDIYFTSVDDSNRVLKEVELSIEGGEVKANSNSGVNSSYLEKDVTPENKKAQAGDQYQKNIGDSKDTRIRNENYSDSGMRFPKTGLENIPIVLISIVAFGILGWVARTFKRSKK